MPFTIVRNDITKMKTDAIVNTANPQPIYAGGTDRAVYEAAGAERLLAERRKIGPMKPGQAAITPGFALPAKYIIHTVGPAWEGGDRGEEETLARCYRNCLRIAKEQGCESIAFPLIATGIYGFPKDKALRIALDSFSEFLTKEDMQIDLVVFGHSALQLSRHLLADIDSFIDDHYVEERMAAEYVLPSKAAPSLDRSDAERQLREAQIEEAYDRRRLQGSRDDHSSARAKRPVCGENQLMEAAAAESDSFSAMQPGLSGKSAATSPSGWGSGPKRSLEDILGHADETFQQQLFRLIKERGLSNVEVYTRANLDKRLFAKIKSNVDYMPKKQTALALCLALHLNLDEAKDLIGRAGYSFSPSNKVDLVIRYFIEKEVFDVYTVDVALFDHDLPMLSNYS